MYLSIVILLLTNYKSPSVNINRSWIWCLYQLAGSNGKEKKRKEVMYKKKILFFTCTDRKVDINRKTRVDGQRQLF
jgi:hypothetical protein